MNIDQARESVTRRLAGELTDAEARELDAFIAAHPDFVQEVRGMETTWEKLGLLRGTPSAAPEMGEPLLRQLDGPPAKRMNFWRIAGTAAATVLVILMAAALFQTVSGANRESKKDTLGPIVKAGGSYQEPNDDFFPQFMQVAAKAPAAPTAHLLRARGLVIVKGPEDIRWRLLRRGGEVAIGQSVRVPKTPGFGAVLLGPDGSEIMLRSGSDIAPVSAREWQLKSGAAYFTVAKGDKPFVVRTPQGAATATGTQFALYAGSDALQQQKPATLCEVAEGAVQISSGQGKPVAISAGKAGLLDDDGARAVDATPGSKDWLTQLQTRMESDESVAQLVADAGADGQKMPLEIRSYGVNVTVVDGVARTFLDMVFVNHTDRRLEGTFFYTLPPDASISEFAMFVGDQRIVGEVLEQQRARQVFEYIRREQRDPALLEWVGGNLFKMRVYPIEPRSGKRVQLGYTQILHRRQGQVTYTFPLVSEMLTKNPLRSLNIEMSVRSTPGFRAIQCPTYDVVWQPGGEKDKALAFSAKDYTPARDFQVNWSVPDSAECLVLGGARPEETDGYLMAQVDPRVPVGRRSPPQRVLIIVDGSASVDAQSFSVAKEFAAGVSDMAQQWEFNVALAGPTVRFMRDEFKPAESGDSEVVRTFLETRKPLGGTDLLEMFKAVAGKLPPGKPVQVVYVGDGVDALGELEGKALQDAIVKLFAGKPVVLSTASVGSSYDKPMLAGLAARLGGTFRPVEGVTDVFAAADEVLDEFTRPVFRDVKITFEGVEVAAVYPPELGTLAVGDTGLCLGRVLKGGRGRLIVTGTADGAAFSRTYDVDLSPTADAGKFLPRLWAKAHMDALRSQMNAGSRDGWLRDQIIATSINYQIMSPFTAFLVLESEEDYKRFGIVRRVHMVDWKSGETAAKPKAQPRARLPLLPEPAVFTGLSPVRHVDAYRSSSPSMVSGPSPMGFNGWGGSGAHFAQRGGFTSELTDYRYFNLNGKDFAFKQFETAGESIWNLDGGSGNLGYTLNGVLTASDRLPLDLEEEPLGRRVLKEDLFLADGKIAGDFARDGILAEPSLVGGDVEAFTWDGDAPAVANKPWGLFSLSDVRRSKRSNVRYDDGYFDSLESHGIGTPPAGCLDRNGLAELKTDDGKSLKIERPGPSEAAAKRATLAKPDSLQDRLNLMMALTRAGKPRAALHEMDLLQTAAAQSAPLWLERAWLLWQAGDATVSDAAHAKAVALATAQKNPTLLQQAAQELNVMGRYAEAAAEFEALAGTADEDQSVNFFGQAYTSRVSAGDPDAATIWPRALAKWPDSVFAHTQALNRLQNADPKLALACAEWLAAHGQPRAQQHAQLLYQAGRKEEAATICEKAFNDAKDANAASSVLYACREFDRKLLSDLVATALDKGRGPQFEGAVQYFSSYGGVRSLTKKLFEAAQRADFPDRLRQQTFYSLHNRGGLNEEWAKILTPLFEKAQEKDTRPLAFNALQALVNYYSARSQVAYDRLAALPDLQDNERSQLASARWTIDSNSGQYDAALDHLEAAFRAEKSAANAANHYSTLMYQLTSDGQYDRVEKLLLNLIERFPDDATGAVANAWRNTARHLAQQRQGARLKALAEKVDKAMKPAGWGEFAKRYDEAAKLAREKEYAKSCALLPGLCDALEARVKELTPIVEKQAQAAKSAQEKASAAPADAALQTAWQSAGSRLSEQVRELSALTALLGRARSLWAMASAQDEHLRTTFLADCLTRCGTEDAITRDWTEARLLCVRSADVKEYRAALESLCAAEPNDPVWPRRLVNALVATGEPEKGRALLEKLYAADPEDASLAMTWFGWIEAAGDEKAAMAALPRLLTTVSQNPSLLQGIAQQWQQRNRPAFAAEAYLALSRTDNYRNNEWPISSAASLFVQAGQHVRAAEICMALLNDSSRREVAVSATLQQASSVFQNEEALRLLEKKLPALLESKEPERRIAALLLARRAAIMRGQKEDAANYLNALMQIPPRQANTAFYQVVEALRSEKRYDDMAAYARSGDAPAQQRVQMLQHVAQLFANDKETADRGVALYREVLALTPQQRAHYERQLVDALIRAGRLDDARAELKTLPADDQDWQTWNAWEQVIQAYRNKQRREALKLALEAWKVFGEDTTGGYGNSAYSTLVNLCYDEATTGPEDARQTALGVMLEHGRRFFMGEPNMYFQNIHVYRTLRPELRKLADEAARSGDPVRLDRAGEFYSACISDQTERMTALEGVSRDLLALKFAPQQFRANAFSRLYTSYTNAGKWAEALALLDPWKGTGNLNEGGYLHNKARCLYPLKRQDEARKAVQAYIAVASRQRDYWTLKNVAGLCRQNGDAATAVACLDAALHIMPRASRNNLGELGNIYVDLGQAYGQAGEREKAIETLLRGMSLFTSNDNTGNFINLRQALVQVMKKGVPGGLDAAVEKYEKTMRAKGEMPQMRVAFGYAYRDEAGQEMKALAQFAIAADLLPKDSSLRKEVVEGYARLKNYEEAEKAYLSWAKLDPQNIEVYKGLGALYEKMGRPEDAMAAYASMPQVLPGEAEGHRAYAQTLAQKGLNAKAVTEYLKARTRRPTEFAIARELAAVYDSLDRKGEKAKLWSDGEAACRRAMEDLADDPLPWLNCARFLNAEGKKAEARALCQDIASRSWPRFASETRSEAQQILKSLD